jgi:hypothetical protein
LQACGPLLLLASNIPAGGIRRITHLPGMRSDFTFEIAVDIFAITVGAFHPSCVMRNLEPDAWVAKRALASVTGHTVAVDNLCFWCLDRHLRDIPFSG